MQSLSINQVKGAQFIDKSTKIRETFSSVSPVEVLRAVTVFAGGPKINKVQYITIECSTNFDPAKGIP